MPRKVSRKWSPRPEVETKWWLEEYKNLDTEFLKEICRNRHITDQRCVDAGKTVILREKLAAMTNARLEELGFDLEECELDVRSFAMATFEYCCKHKNSIVTISAPSRSRYLLVSNGSAAEIANWTIENIGRIEIWRDRVETTSEAGRKAAMRKPTPNVLSTTPGVQ